MVYTVERCCGRETMESVTVDCSSLGTPRQVLENILAFHFSAVPINPDEDYFRVIDPAGATWLWAYRDGKLVRLLRPPVAPENR